MFLLKKTSQCHPICIESQEPYCPELEQTHCDRVVKSVQNNQNCSIAVSYLHNYEIYIKSITKTEDEVFSYSTHDCQ